MNDKLDELHYIYKIIGNYGFCTVQELLDKYNNLQERVDKAIKYIESNISLDTDMGTIIDVTDVLSILKGEDNEC